MSQLIRKLKRNKKTAYKFGFKLTYHEITLTHDQDYTPSSLVIRWSRGHRQVVSTKAIWTPGTQPNPSGQLCGNGVFDPPCTVELLVTLYKEQKSELFEEKDYKFVLEDEADVGGRKALGVFSINIGQFADMLGSSNDVTMEMKSLVKKVSEALVDVTIKSDFLKTGKVGDDDMMSTWSAMSGLVDDGDDEQSDLSTETGVSLETSNSEQNLGASRNLKESLSFFDLKPAESYYEFMKRNAADDTINSQGTIATLENLKNAKAIGLFFAANSSPQCKFFLSTLDSFYNSLYEVRPGDFELLFISCDYNDAEMLDFMQDSGVCYPGVKPTSILAEALKEKFEISNIPEVIVISPRTGELVDRDGRVKIERCGGNEDCFEIIDHWIAGKPAPLRAEIELNVKLTSQLSEDGGDQKAKIVSKEEKKRQEKLEKERRKKEEEEKRRRERLEKEEKKKLEREEKKKQRDREKSEKRSKRASTSHNPELNITEGDVPENGDFDQNETSTEASLAKDPASLDPKAKPTLFELAGGQSPGSTRHEIAEPAPEPEPEPEVEIPTKKKEKEKTKEKDKEESGIFKLPKGSDGQLREAKSRILDLEHINKNLSERSEVLYQAKVQLENEKDDLTERVIELSNNVEDFTEQVRELTENRDTLARENQEKGQQVDSLQEERLGLKEDLNGARAELESIRQQLSQSKLKLIEYETDKQAKDEERQQLLATTELQGWLYKRGVRGMTGKKWRRRFFHMGQGFKLYYYKTSSMQLPQGYIDLEKVKQVGVLSEEKQDKNKSSFYIEVEGRVFELLAMDIAMRDQWINAVKFLVEYRGKYKVDVRTLSGSKEGPNASAELPANGSDVPGEK